MGATVGRKGNVYVESPRAIQGSQYTSQQFQDLLKEHGITSSMSRACEVWDNSAMKTERIARKVYRSREQARADVFD